MKIENSFTVGVPIEEAWEAMLDLERIAPCLPGASINEADGDEYKGTMMVKIGPISAKYEGTVKYEETDEQAHRAVLHATGQDARGQGTASATITSTMEEGAEGTKVNVETDMKLTGRAAQFGRGIQQDVAEKMLGQFAECLEQRLAGEEPEAETAEASNGSAAAGASAGAAGNGAASSGEEKPKTRKINQPEPEPLDLGEMSQEAVMKRVTPVLIGVGVLLVLVWILRRRH